ncbi:MAG TPA: hypothetical protein IAA75_08420 [Candidatus Pullichristensenella avicola]|nr:hypothetical protein [Candidatus Pullichristensenella avicola]
MKRILCYGDSNTWGFNPHGCDEVSGAHLRYGEDVRWTAQLARLLSCTVLEAGLNGRTTVFDDPTSEGRNGLAHLAPILLSCDPVDAVVVMLGTNDVKDMFSAPALNISEGLERLVRSLRALLDGSLSHGAKILLISPIALTAGADGAYFYGFSADSTRKIAELAPLVRDVAKRQHCAYLDAALYAAPDPLDGVHIAPEGHATLAEAVAKALRELL